MLTVSHNRKEDTSEESYHIEVQVKTEQLLLCETSSCANTVVIVQKPKPGLFRKFNTLFNKIFSSKL